MFLCSFASITYIVCIFYLDLIFLFTNSVTSVISKFVFTE